MKKYLLIGSIIGAVIVGGLFVYHQTKVFAVTTALAPYYPDTSATTSVVYLTAGGAASDKVIPVREWEMFSIDTQLNASSTSTVGGFKLYASYDGIDYFDLPNVTIDSAIANTVGSTTAAYTITPQTAGINRYSVLINPADHNYIKVSRYCTSANCSIWQMIVPMTDL